MKVIHVPFCFYPDPIGGTEVYVAALARDLRTYGVESLVAAPGETSSAYEYGSLRVKRYALSPELRDLRAQYGEGDRVAAERFTQILSQERPDVVHLHGFTQGVSLRVVRAAKARMTPVVFTYHTPTVTCQRGTMMRWGTQPCDGVMELHTCARCTLHGLFEGERDKEYEAGTQASVASAVRNKLATVLADLLGSLSPVFGFWLGQRNLQGGHWTALRMTELVELRHTTIRALFAEVDHIVAVSQWVKDTLMRNGIPEVKITLCRQGVVEETNLPIPKSEQSKHHVFPPLRIAFLGRLDSTKGVEVLILALLSIPQAPLQLDIYGVVQGEAGLRHERQLVRLAATDRRIQFHAPVPRDEVMSTLCNYDLLAVPSQWLETGPLVILEAFAAGVPVIGSRLGGIAELVRDGVDGILVQPADVECWSRAFRRLSEDASAIEALRRNVRPPRRMATVAKEMAALYRQVLSHGVVACAPSAVASSI